MYFYFNIPRHDPLVIQQCTPILNEAQQSGLFVLFYEVFHPTLGQGAKQGFVQTKLGTENGTSVLVNLGVPFLLFHPMSLVLTDKYSVVLYCKLVKTL